MTKMKNQNQNQSQNAESCRCEQGGALHLWCELRLQGVRVQPAVRQVTV